MTTLRNVKDIDPASISSDFTSAINHAIFFYLISLKYFYIIAYKVKILSPLFSDMI